MKEFMYTVKDEQGIHARQMKIFKSRKKGGKQNGL